MQRVRLNPATVVTSIAAGVLFRSDLGTFQLDGADVAFFVEAIIPLLDGKSSDIEIAEKLPQYSKDSIIQLLELLLARGIVQEASDRTSQAEGSAEFFRVWSLDPLHAAERLQNARVLIVGLEPWGVAAAASLADAGVGAIHVLNSSDGEFDQQRVELLTRDVTRRYPDCSFSSEALRLTDDGQLSIQSEVFQLIVTCLRADELRVLMAVARFGDEHGIPSLHGTMEDFSAIAGPLVIPGQTPCWNCTRLRLLANATNPEVTHALQSALLRERPQSRVNSYLAPMTALLGQLLTIEAIKHISRFSSSTLAGHQLVQNLISLETTRHAILRMPWCEVCGGASRRCATKTESASPKTPLNDVSSPEQLRKLLEGVVDERTGLVSRLAVHPAEAEDPELPITSSAVLCSYTDGHYHERPQEVGSGKALSAVGSMIGSVGEAVERYSAARYRKRDMHRAARKELDGESLDPATLSLYAEDRYSDPAFPFQRFDEAQPIEWVKGKWLHSGKPVWLPALPVYFNFHAPKKEQFCQVSSNGLAAGSDEQDAAWRATFELVERDTFMLTWLARHSGRKILLDGGIDSSVREVVRQLTRTGAHIECCALDVGTGIPVVACLGWGDGRQWPGVTVSIAAHRHWGRAVEKAILEQGHVGPYIRRLAKQEGTKLPEQAADVRVLIDHALYYVDPARAAELAFLGSGGEVSYSSLTEQQELTDEECLERLSTAGLQIAIANVTSPDLLETPFRVARALGNYIQQIDFGYHMRRLANPRLDFLLMGREPNPAPHPIA